MIVSTLTAEPSPVMEYLVLFDSSIPSFCHCVVCSGIANASQVKDASVPVSCISGTNGAMMNGASAGNSKYITQLKDCKIISNLLCTSSMTVSDPVPTILEASTV